MWRLFFLLAQDHLRHRPLRTGLTILGVAVGVSAWLAIRTANTEVYQSFEQSVDLAVGQTAVIVTGGRQSLDEQLLAPLQGLPGIKGAHPLIRLEAMLRQDTGGHYPVTILGLDLLEQAEEFFRPAFEASSEGQEVQDWEAILSSRAIFLNREFAHRLGLQLGESLVLEFQGKPVELIIRGLVDSSAVKGQPPGYHQAILDIASAQWLFGLVGRIHEIHLIPHRGVGQEALLADVRDLLPPSVTVRVVSRRNGAVEGMLRAFQLNLTMLSGIALLVGLFLVFNTMAFSVAQHRKEIGILRALGMERGAIRRVFLLEAGLLGGVGGLLGCAVGVWMARFLLILVRESVGELYGLQSPLSSSGWNATMIIEGTILGILVSLVGAFRPSWEASRMPPVQALALTPTLDASPRGGGAAGTVAGVAFVSTWVLSLIPPVDGIPWGGYGAALCLLVGGTAMGPFVVALLGKTLKGAGITRRWGVWPSLAADQMIRHVGRTSVTLSAMVVGLSIMVGVSLMIHSFRQTVQWWIEQTIVADIIVAPDSWLGADEEGSGLPVGLRSALQDLPGVGAVDPYREVHVEANGRSVALVSRDFAVHAGRSRYVFLKGDSSDILRRAIETKGVLVSEVLAQRLAVQVGQVLMIRTPKGRRGFVIEGIFYDYATDGGKVVMDDHLYRTIWPDRRTTVFAVYLDPGAGMPEIRTMIEQARSSEVSVSTISNRELRSEILEIFDRTFRVTYVLEAIALAVAILGIVNTLLTAIMERRRELSTLRALGASTAQIKTLIYWEAGYLAFWGAGIGLAVGMALSVLLITVINKQSFGWTIPWTMSLQPLLMACLVAGVAVLLGAWWPARLASRHVISSGLRYE